MFASSEIYAQTVTFRDVWSEDKRLFQQCIVSESCPSSLPRCGVEFSPNEYPISRVFKIHSLDLPPGAVLTYGSLIQFRHVLSRTFMRIKQGNTGSSVILTAEVEADKYQSQSYFRILPRYKLRTEGEKVYINDPIRLAASYSDIIPQYLSVSEKSRPCLTVGLASCAWLAHVFRPYTESHNHLMTGQVIRLLHSELDAYLAVNTPWVQRCELNLGQVEICSMSLKPCQLSLLLEKEVDFKSAWQLWILESIQKQGRISEIISFTDPFRLKHICTGMYLSLSGSNLENVQNNNSVVYCVNTQKNLPDDIDSRGPFAELKTNTARQIVFKEIPDNSCVFAFYTSNETKGKLSVNSVAQLRHVQSGMWVCGLPDRYDFDTTESLSMAVSTAEKADEIKFAQRSGSSSSSSDDEPLFPANNARITRARSLQAANSSQLTGGREKEQDSKVSQRATSRPGTLPLSSLHTDRGEYFRAFTSQVPLLMDSFVLEVAKDSEIYSVVTILSQKPALWKLFQYLLDPAQLDQLDEKFLTQVCGTISDLGRFCMHDSDKEKTIMHMRGHNIHHHQHLLRSLDVILLCLMLLEAIAFVLNFSGRGGSGDSKVLKMVSPRIYSVLRLAVLKNSRQQQYLWRFSHILTTHLKLDPQITMEALPTLKAMYSGCQVSITSASEATFHDYLSLFDTALRSKMPDFLSVFCESHNGIRVNQNTLYCLIAQKMLFPQLRLDADGKVALLIDSRAVGTCSTLQNPGPLEVFLAGNLLRYEWVDFHAWYSTAKRNKADKEVDFLRGTFWLIRSFCLGRNLELMMIFRQLLQFDALYASLSIPSIEHKFKRNLCEVLQLIYIDDDSYVARPSVTLTCFPKNVVLPHINSLPRHTFAESFSPGSRPRTRGTSNHKQTPSAVAAQAPGGTVSFLMAPVTKAHVAVKLQSFVFPFLNNPKLLNPSVFDAKLRDYDTEHWHTVYALAVLEMIKKMVFLRYFEPESEGAPDPLVLLTSALIHLLARTRPQVAESLLLIKNERNKFMCDAKRCALEILHAIHCLQMERRLVQVLTQPHTLPEVHVQAFY